MNEQSYEYRTGQTQPEKSSRGLIAFLLICVIFLCGLVSVLGAMNIHLLSQLRQNDTESPLSFSDGDTTPVDSAEESLTLGEISVQELPELYQQIYELPAGLYVVDAPENGLVAPGDVLTAFGSTAVSSLAELRNLKNACQAGQQIALTFYRQDAQPFTHTITFGN